MQAFLVSLLALVLLAGPGWGGVMRGVAHEGDTWTIQHEAVRVEISEKDFSLCVTTARGVHWDSLEPTGRELTLRTSDGSKEVALASARKITWSDDSTGTGNAVRASLKDFGLPGVPEPTQLDLVVRVEGVSGELLFEVIPVSDPAGALETVRWPLPFRMPRSHSAYTLYPLRAGAMIPGDYPIDVSPTRYWPSMDWVYSFGMSMAWWAQAKGQDGFTAIFETPWDAGCALDHPAGGPTLVQPYWRASMGSVRYPRRIRYAFQGPCSYVALAKRYRAYMKETGQLRTLAEKEAANPAVGRLKGTAIVHSHILYHVQPDSHYYSKDNLAANHDLVRFDKRAEQLRVLRKHYGKGNLYLHLDGWGVRGYDNLHPDYLPPNEEAGGWEGMRALEKTCRENGIVFGLHDQYRDFYMDAPSFDKKLCLTNRDGSIPDSAFWYGGRQSVLCAKPAADFIRRNYAELEKNGVRPEGTYLDVFSIVELEECWNPDHPMTRKECMEARLAGLRETRSRGIITSSEEGLDWAIPALDLMHHEPYSEEKTGHSGIPAPLYQLVWHDCVAVPWGLGKGSTGRPNDLGLLHCLLNGGVPYLGITANTDEIARVKVAASLHKRVGWLEMVDHQFLDKDYRRQQSRFADGTVVEVDFEKDTYTIAPPLR